MTDDEWKEASPDDKLDWLREQMSVRRDQDARLWLELQQITSDLRKLQRQVEALSRRD